MQKLDCVSCGAPLDEADINTAAGIATYRHCKAVFAIHRATPHAAQGESAAPPPVAKKSITMPPGFTVDETPEHLDITKRWHGCVYLLVLLFGLFWCGLAFGFMAIFGHWVTILMGVLPALPGLVGVYAGIAGLLNHTHVRVESGSLVVRSGPVPWPGNKSFETPQIDQLYCYERVHRGSDDCGVTYDLRLRTSDGKSHTLLAGFSQPEEAIYIEQQIERHLGIEDTSVAGEFRS